MRAAAKTQIKKILDAAAEIFAARGFAGARVDDIAASAGMNKRLLYHYVGTKAELLSAVLTRQAQELDASSLSSPQLWSLLLAEAADTGSTQLLRSLLDFELHQGGGNVSDRLSRAMFAALLPAGDEMLSELTGARDDSRKPRIRMMPQVVAASDSQRSSAKRSK
jgi:AcrR family transcriptional regulator